MNASISVDLALLVIFDEPLLPSLPVLFSTTCVYLGIDKTREYGFTKGFPFHGMRQYISTRIYNDLKECL